MDLWVNVERPTSPATTNYVQGGPKGPFNEDLAETGQNLELRAGQSQLERSITARKVNHSSKERVVRKLSPAFASRLVLVSPFLYNHISNLSNLLAISDRF